MPAVVADRELKAAPVDRPVRVGWSRENISIRYNVVQQKKITFFSQKKSPRGRGEIAREDAANLLAAKLLA